MINMLKFLVNLNKFAGKRNAIKTIDLFKINLINRNFHVIDYSDKIVKFRPRGNNPPLEEDVLLKKMERKKKEDVINNFKKNLDKSKALTPENKAYIMNFLNDFKIENIIQLSGFLEFFIEKYTVPEIKDIINEITTSRLKLASGLSLKFLNIFINEVTKGCKENQLNFCQEFQQLFAIYKAKLLNKKVNKLDELEFVNFTRVLDNINCDLQSEEIIQLIDIYINFHRQFTVEDKVRVTKNLICITKAKSFVDIKEDRLKEKMEIIYFILINDFRKMPERKTKSIICSRLIEIMGFYNSKFENEQDWKKLNYILKMFKVHFNESITKLHRLICVTRKDLKYFNYNLLCEIYTMGDAEDKHDFPFKKFLDIAQFFIDLVKSKNTGEINPDKILKVVIHDCDYFIDKLEKEEKEEKVEKVGKEEKVEKEGKKEKEEKEKIVKKVGKREDTKLQKAKDAGEASETTDYEETGGHQNFENLKHLQQILLDLNYEDPSLEQLKTKISNLLEGNMS